MTNVVAGENENFWNMLLWEISGPGQQTWNPLRGHKLSIVFRSIACCTPKNFTQNDKERETKFLIKFFSKPCPNLAFLAQQKGAPHKSIFPVRFPLFFRVRQFGPRWCGNLFTWNLFVSLMLLLAKKNLFDIYCCGKFLGLGNKHGTHEGAKRFECYVHDAHPKISHKTAKKGKPSS